MRQRMAGLVLTAIVAAGADIVSAQIKPPSVRPEDPGARELIATGLERSATFRELAARLDQSDVVVYVRFSRCIGNVEACLLWASESAGVRRLVIKLNRVGRSPNELTALLAHELQHANEVASAPEIRDPASFRKSFEARGWKHADGLETEQAVEVGRRVATELSHAGAPLLSARR